MQRSTSLFILIIIHMRADFQSGYIKRLVIHPPTCIHHYIVLLQYIYHLFTKKLTASTVWDEDRASRSNKPIRVAGGHKVVVHDRSSAHVAAWHSTKRDANEVGRHFKLDECRVWMRLHFWALREVVGEASPSFVDYYIRYIGHFVSVYEGTGKTVN